MQTNQGGFKNWCLFHGDEVPLAKNQAVSKEQNIHPNTTNPKVGLCCVAFRMHMPHNRIWKSYTWTSQEVSKRLGSVGYKPQ